MKDVQIDRVEQTQNTYSESLLSLDKILQQIKPDNTMQISKSQGNLGVSHERMYQVIDNLFNSLNTRYNKDLSPFEYFRLSNHYINVFKRIFRLLNETTRSGAYANCAILFIKKQEILSSRLIEFIQENSPSVIKFYKTPTSVIANQLNFNSIIPFDDLLNNLRYKNLPDFFDSLESEISSNSISGVGFKFSITEQRIIDTLCQLIRKKQDFESSDYQLTFKKSEFTSVYSSTRISGREWKALFISLYNLACKKYLIMNDENSASIIELFQILENNEQRSRGEITLKFNQKIFNTESNRYLLLDSEFRERVYRASQGTKVCEEMGRIYYYLVNQNFKKDISSCLQIKTNTIRFAEIVKESNIEKIKLKNLGGIPFAKIIDKFDKAFSILRDAGYIDEFQVDKENIHLLLNGKMFYKNSDRGKTYQKTS